MPLYEYECESCGHRFERIQKFSDPPPDTCPSCHAGPLKKLFSSPAIQFKGTGWYITDYAKKPSTDGGSPGAAKTDSAGKPESKSESKSDSGGTPADKPAATTTKSD